MIWTIHFILTSNWKLLGAEIIQRQINHYEFFYFIFSYNAKINLSEYSEKMENSVSMNREPENSQSMNWESENSHQKSQSMSFGRILQGFTESGIWLFMTNTLCFCFRVLGESFSYSSVKVGSRFEKSFTKFKSWVISTDM